MLELRPTCENCNRPLPPDATDAMICTIECTFCRDCVDTVLSNVCPNCGGGFERRPIRPAHVWVEGAPAVPAALDEGGPQAGRPHGPRGAGRLDRRAVTLAALTPCAAQPR